MPPAAHDPTTLPRHFQRVAARAPEAIALQSLGGDVHVTWREYADRVRRLATGLAGLGVTSGDPVALLVGNRPEFHLGDTAVLHLGAVPFSLYLTSTDQHLADTLDHAGPRVLLTERALLERVEGLDAACLRHVVVLDDAAAPASAGRYQVHTADRLPAPPDGFDLDASWQAVRPEDPAVLIYTSGTTGTPKCVELSHANIDFALWSAQQRYGVPDKGALISYLPQAHVADRLFAHYPNLTLGWPVTTVEDPHHVSGAIAQVHPTWLLGVPRIWERMRSALAAKLHATDDQAYDTTQRALDAALERIALLRAAEPVPDRLSAEVAEAETEIFGPLRAQLGLDAVSIVLSGAAPLAPAVHEFFLALGLPLTEAYGLTESTGVGLSNEPHRDGDDPVGCVDCVDRVGWVGTAMPGTEARLADDGELLLRGPHLMTGYRGDPGLTEATVDEDGWLHTGDLAEQDDTGRFRIVDRRDEMIVSSTGINISPAHVESTLKGASTLIGQVACIGDGRPYLVALIVLDHDAATAFATRHDLADHTVEAVAADPRVAEEVDRAVEEANRSLAEPHRVRRHALLAEQWLPDGEELTPAMKLRRDAIERAHADQIEELYRSDG